MKSVLMSINSLHNANIECGKKLSELRTRPPKLKPPFKVYTYESGSLGRHKVVNEWVCSDMEIWRMCMGIPAHLSKKACVSDEYIWKYSNFGYKDITEMEISDLVIYDKPKELSEFQLYENIRCSAFMNRVCFHRTTNDVIRCENIDCSCKKLIRPPQSWCYVEGVEGK